LVYSSLRPVRHEQ